MRDDLQPALDIVHALDDPLRYAVLTRLVAGPATVSELIAETGAAQSQLSNHLAVLFERRVVTRTRNGRFIAYALAGPEIAAILESIESAAPPARPSSADGHVPDIVRARRCYDHLAGRLGVAIFAALVERRALAPIAAGAAARKVHSGLGDVSLGKNAAGVFAEFGIDVDDVAARRRRFATACNDWTESRPHLAGALGAALCAALCGAGWLQRRSGTRVMRVTPNGRRELSRRFGPLVARALA